MNRTNEALSYAIYMANRWNEYECSYVFNGYSNIEYDNYEYSLGHHIWKKYMEYYKDYGMYGAPMRLLYELDSTNLELLLNRACELYDGRKNRC